MFLTVSGQHPQLDDNVLTMRNLHYVNGTQDEAGYEMPVQDQPIYLNVLNSPNIRSDEYEASNTYDMILEMPVKADSTKFDSDLHNNYVNTRSSGYYQNID